MRSIHCPSTPMSMTRSANTEPVSTAGATPCKGAADMTASASTNGAALGVSCAGAVMLASGIGDAPALSPEDAEMACEDAELAARATGEAPGDGTALAGAAAWGEGTPRHTTCNSGRASPSARTPRYEES